LPGTSGGGAVRRSENLVLSKEENKIRPKTGCLSLDYKKVGRRASLREEFQPVVEGSGAARRCEKSY
jgi:hypothetical protein